MDTRDHFLILPRTQPPPPPHTHTKVGDPAKHFPVLMQRSATKNRGSQKETEQTDYWGRGKKERGSSKRGGGGGGALFAFQWTCEQKSGQTVRPAA